jgi:hypothetical protein
VDDFLRKFEIWIWIPENITVLQISIISDRIATMASVPNSQMLRFVAKET